MFSYCVPPTPNRAIGQDDMQAYYEWAAERSPQLVNGCEERVAQTGRQGPMHAERQFEAKSGRETETVDRQQMTDDR